MAGKANGTTKETQGDEKVAARVKVQSQRNIARANLRDAFSKVVMSMISLPRYRHQSIADLQQIVLEPLVRDRIAIASTTGAENSDLAGVAIWASVSEEVDAKIREQIRAGVFPLRLKPEEWNSGTITWLLDVIATNKDMTVSVISNFKQLSQSDDLRLHPIISRLVDTETLEKMGAIKPETETKTSAS